VLVLVYWGIRKLNEQKGGAVAAVSNAVSNVLIVAGKTATDAGEAVSEAASGAASKAASKAANMIRIVNPHKPT
jgi:hypothetical protein